LGGAWVPGRIWPEERVELVNDFTTTTKAIVAIVDVEEVICGDD
jgi:hypothetical protein